MKKFVVYTVMTGGYDEIEQPAIIDERFDYVLFSNDFDVDYVGIWQVRRIPSMPEMEGNYQHLLSRYPKTHPETLLSEYEASLYKDANMQFVDSYVYNRCVEIYEKGGIYGTVQLYKHPYIPEFPRDCIYRHAYEVACMGVIHDYDAIKAMHKIYKTGFPEHYGMNENGLIFRRHTAWMKEVDEEWWQEILHLSFRDQFSLMYVFWKNNFKPTEYLLPEGDATWTGLHMSVKKHDKKAVTNRKVTRKSFFELVRLKTRNYYPKNYLTYSEHWMWMLKRPYPEIWNFCWGIVFGIYNLPLTIVRYIQKRNERQSHE